MCAQRHSTKSGEEMPLVHVHGSFPATEAWKDPPPAHLLHKGTLYSAGPCAKGLSSGLSKALQLAPAEAVFLPGLRYICRGALPSQLVKPLQFP